MQIPSGQLGTIRSAIRLPGRPSGQRSATGYQQGGSEWHATSATWGCNALWCHSGKGVKGHVKGIHPHAVFAAQLTIWHWRHASGRGGHQETGHRGTRCDRQGKSPEELKRGQAKIATHLLHSPWASYLKIHVSKFRSETEALLPTPTPLTNPSLTFNHTVNSRTMTHHSIVKSPNEIFLLSNASKWNPLW